MRLLIFLLFFSTVVHAQSFEQGDKLLNVGLGIGNVLGSGSTVFPPTQVTFEYGVTESISVGGFIGYAANKVSYGIPFTSDSDEIKTTFTYFGARVSYHFYNTEKIDVYGSGGLGYYTSSISDGDPDYYDIKLGGFAYDISIGGRYYFNEKIGMFTELGYGISILQFGLAAKF